MVSSKPRKTRKFYANLSLHLKGKNIACHLNEKLAKEVGKRALPVRKGDVVKVMRGFFEGREGKVTKVDRVQGLVFIEKVVRKKSNGSEVEVGFDASNLLLTDIDKNDKERVKTKKN